MNTGELPEIALSLENRILTGSVRIKPGHHALPDVWRKGALVIDADDVVIDFQGATMTPGDDVHGQLDQLEGYGILVKNRRNVTIRNAVVHGYRFNICVLGGENVRIENCDASYSRAHRISAGGVPLDQWVVIREIRDWHTYGAGIWLENVRAGVVRQCRAGGAQNGLVLATCDHCLVIENDFSFNSGWGLALWASCDNVVSWNLTDFCDRPWAGGLGADAACVTMTGNSHRNYVVGNSMTHGGDGFFLTGLSDGTLDARLNRLIIAGPCDDNVIAHNDGSWSPANAFEGTFAYRNMYYKNQANDCNYGFWLGFSSDSLILDNDVGRNRVSGIALEQGSGTRVEGNRFTGNRRVAVHLWATHGAARDRYPSRDIEIRGNVIKDSPAAVDLTNSTDYYVGENTLESAPLPAGLASTKPKDEPSALARFLASPQYRRLQEILSTRPPGFRFYPETGGPCGWDWTDIGDFAPRDFRGDLAACRRVDAGAIELFVFDPERTQIDLPAWAVLTRDPESGDTDPSPKRKRGSTAQRAKIEVPAAPASGSSVPAVGEIRPCFITLRRGDRVQEIRRNLVNCTWHVKWFDWSGGGTVPLPFDDVAGWRALFAKPPLRAATVRDLGWELTDRNLADGLPSHHYALVAKTRLRLPAGKRRLCVTFDDGLRLRVDGREVYANWRRNRPQFADVEVPLDAGEHELEVEYCYENRYSVLRWHWGEPV